jgi:hypothetical protein
MHVFSSGSCAASPSPINPHAKFTLYSRFQIHSYSASGQLSQEKAARFIIFDYDAFCAG